MSDIIPICIYYSKKQQSVLFDYPVKYRKDNTDKYKCDDKQNMEKITTIYCIRPDLRPIPPDCILFCADNNNTSFIPYTKDIYSIYDPFDYEAQSTCVRFIAWRQVIKNATPLYIYTNNKFLMIYVGSFDEKNIPTDFKYDKTIYVLTNPDIGFTYVNERCVPDPYGTDISTCIIESSRVNSDKSYTPGILDILKKEKKGNPNLLPYIVCIIYTIIIILYLK